MCISFATIQTYNCLKTIIGILQAFFEEIIRKQRRRGKMLLQNETVTKTEMKEKKAFTGSDETSETKSQQFPGTNPVAYQVYSVKKEKKPIKDRKNWLYAKRICRRQQQIVKQ